MNRRGRTAALVLGLISGIINIIIGVIVLILGGLAAGAAGSLSSFFGLSYFGWGAGVIWLVVTVFFVVTLLNLIGGCIVRRSRVAAGVLMIITSIPLFCVGLIALAIPDAAGPLLFMYLLVQLMSFIAAIIAFVPPSVKSTPHNVYQQQPYGQPPYGQPPYGQPRPPAYQPPPYEQPQPERAYSPPPADRSDQPGESISPEE